MLASGQWTCGPESLGESLFWTRSKTIGIQVQRDRQSCPGPLRESTEDPADLKQKLAQPLHAVDPHPKVVSMRNMPGLGWTVS